MSHQHDISRWLYETVKDDRYIVTVGAIKNRWSSLHMINDMINRYNK